MSSITKPISILDANPLEHITGDIAISQYNYESVLNGLVQWNMSKADNITIRVATRTDPYFVDYVIPTKYFYDRHYGSVVSERFLAPTLFSVDNKMTMVAASGDNVTLRVNAENTGNTDWSLYKDVTVYEEYIKEEDDDGLATSFNISQPEHVLHTYDKAGLFIKTFDETTHEFKLYVTNARVTTNDEWATLLSSGKISEVCPVKNINTAPGYASHLYGYKYDTDITVYEKILNYSVDPTKNVWDSTSGYIEYCKSWKENTGYPKGSLVYYKGDIFVAVKDMPTIAPVIINVTDDGLIPTNNCTFNTTEWRSILPLKLVNKKISESGVLRIEEIDTDVNGFILRNVGKTESSDDTNITIVGNLAFKGGESAQHTGLDIFRTSNYAYWPDYTSQKWLEGTIYSTVDTKSAYEKQDYSAVMVFDHTNPDIKYKNIINYDGPDLDQGLCIMLPVLVADSDNVVHTPSDGMMWEFMFNIWPNHKYDGKSVNDLIINKSQIYVYSVPDYSEYRENGFTPRTVQPIAKFTMARLTNFYVFSENIGVPDKPVCYKARFIYSKTEGRWKTYDYYQLPDHIFLSPNGFVDPTEKQAYGVQTAGFPMWQNPFSNYELSAIQVTEEYRNQVLLKDE